MAESKTTTDQPGTGRQQLVASPFAASPFQLMRRMSEEMDRMFDRVLGGAPGDRGALSPGGVAAWSPRVEVFQKQDKFIVRAELPGISKDDVRVEIGADQLIVQGQRREAHE